MQRARSPPEGDAGSGKDVDMRGSPRRRSIRLLAGTLLALAASSPGRSADTRATAPRAVRVEQVTTGIPNPEPGGDPLSKEQVLTLSADGARLALDEFRPAPSTDQPRQQEARYILRTDRTPPVIWSISPDGSRYREFEGNLNRLQRDRDVYERQLLELLPLRSPEKQKQILESNFLRRDGSRFVDLTRGESRTILGYRCQRVTVTENGRVIIDAWISEDVVGGRSFFDLYRRLGAFSTEVLQKIKDLRGLPLQASFTVVTKLPSYDLEVEVKKVEEVDLEPGYFDLPSGATRIEEQPKVTRCALCGKTVEANEATRIRRSGKLLYFCSPEHKRIYLRSVSPRRRRPESTPEPPR